MNRFVQLVTQRGSPVQRIAAEKFAAFMNSGMAGLALHLLDAKNADGTALAAAASAGKFGISVVAAPILVGEAAQNNTKTDVALIDFVLPDDYVAGEDLTVTINAHYTGAGTVGATKSVDLEAFKSADAGTRGADICATAAIALTGAAGAKAFTVTGTTLSPRDRLLLKVTVALQETANVSAITAQINSIRVA